MGSETFISNRQHDSSPLYKQTRRHQILNYMQSNDRSHKLVYQSQNRFDRDTHIRSSEHYGRYAVQEDISLL